MNARRRRCSRGVAWSAALSVLLPVGVIAAPAGASGSPEASPEPSPVAILAERAVTLDRDTTVRGGAVVARVPASPDGPAGAGQVVLARGARVEGPHGAVVADVVRLERDAFTTLLATNSPDPGAAYRDVYESPLELPVDVPFPDALWLPPGADPVSIERGTTASLGPGAYGDLRVGRGATVHLLGDAYQFASVTVDRDAVVVTGAGTTIAIASGLDVGRDSRIGPADPAVPGPLISVAGTSPEGAAAPPVVAVARGCHVTAHVQAPGGDVRLERETTVVGMLTARSVAIARDSRVTYAPREAPMQVVISSPWAGSTVSGPTAVSAQEVTDADVVAVELRVDGVPVATASAAPFTLTWDADAVPEGPHSLVAVVTDVHGRVAASDPVDVVVRHATPAALGLQLDRVNGVVTADDAARYGVFRFLAPERVPEQYRLEPGEEDTELTVAVIAALYDWDALSLETRQEIERVLSPESDATGVEQDPLPRDVVDAAVARWLTGSPAEPVVPLPPDGAGRLAGTASTADVADTDPAVSARTLVAAATASSYPEPLTMGVLDCPPERDVIDPNARLRCTYRTELTTIRFARLSEHPVDGIAPVDELDSLLRGVTELGGPNGVPDRVDEVVQAFYQATGAYLQMGYEPVGHIEVALEERGASVSWPHVHDIRIDKDSDTDDWNVDGRLVYLMRHELFHQFQYRYGVDARVVNDYLLGGGSTAWWLEASAEWASFKAEDRVFGDPAGSAAFEASRNRFYYSRLDDLLEHPAAGLTTFMPFGGWRPHYGAFLFAQFLEERHGEQIIRETWEAMRPDVSLELPGGIPDIALGGLQGIDAIEQVLEGAYDDDLATLVQRYHATNYSIDSPWSMYSAYRSPSRGLWTAALADTDGRPTREIVTLDSGETSSDWETIGAGGAVYIDLHKGTSSGDQVVDVSVESIDGWGEKIGVQVRYFDSYPKPCPWWEDGGPLRGMEPGDTGDVSSSVVLFPGCANATLIISNVDPTGFPVDVTWTLTARDAGSETVVEDHGRSGWHHRVGEGPDLDEMLAPSSAQDLLTVDIDMAEYAGQRRVSSFCLYSVDYTPRDDDVLLVNGVPLTLEHNRYWADYEGRVFRSFNGRWRTADTSCFHLPDGTVVDGVNTFQLRLQGSIFAYAAFIISHKPNVEPDPGGDPDPDPCANGCAT